MSTAEPLPEHQRGRVSDRSLARVMLAVLCVLLLIAGSLFILSPFLAATVWAATLVVSTWPVMKALEARLGHRRAPAVAVMTATMLLLVIAPLGAAIATILTYATHVSSVTATFARNGLPRPPGWVAGLPLVGEKLSASWTRTSDAGPAGLAALLEPHATAAARWILGHAGTVLGTLIQFLVIVVLSAVLYSKGETVARGLRRFGRRLAGEQGENAVVLAGKATRGVALGVGGTALVQTVLGGLGLLIAGVPFVALLSATMLILCLAQLGPALVLFPAVAWMYWSGDTLWATVLLVWSLVVSTLDNVLRPILIRKGADLPLLLIFAGVVGGLLGFGLIGIFLGPVVLAVSYTLLAAWVEAGFETA